MRGRRVLHGRLATVVLGLLVVAACTSELTSPTEPLRLLATSLPAVYIGEQVDLPLRPTGGLRPYTFAVVDGALPQGLSVAGGRVSGTPAVEGRFAFTVEVSDASLNRTIQRYELLVRPLPVPVIAIDAPATDIQRETQLRLRLESARGWLGAKVEILWDADAFALAPDSVAELRPDIVAFWEGGAGRLRIDLAALGRTIDGELDLLRFTLVPTEPGPLGLTVAAEHRYAGGHHYASRREGAPAVTAPAPGAREQEPADAAKPPEPPPGTPLPVEATPDGDDAEPDPTDDGGAP